MRSPYQRRAQRRIAWWQMLLLIAGVVVIFFGYTQFANRTADPSSAPIPTITQSAITPTVPDL